MDCRIMSKHPSQLEGDFLAHFFSDSTVTDVYGSPVSAL